MTISVVFVFQVHAPYFHSLQDNSVWTITMDTQILEWLNQQPQDWWRTTKSNVYTWGKGTWNQLGHSTRERATAALADDWTDVQQVSTEFYTRLALGCTVVLLVISGFRYD